METDPGGYKEAQTVLESAKKMFGAHSMAITGCAWEWEKADEQVRTIWILKSARALGQQS